MGNSINILIRRFYPTVKDFKFIYKSDVNFLIDDYLNFLSTSANASKNTRDKYGIILTQFFKFLKRYRCLVDHNIPHTEIPINDIDQDFLEDIQIEADDIYMFMSYLENELNNAAITRANKIPAIRGFFVYVISVKRFNIKNAVDMIRKPKTQQRYPTYLTYEESLKLLNSIKGKYASRDYAILVVFLNTGLRLSELCGLNLFDTAIARFSITGKGNKERILYFNTSCLDAIDKYLETRSVLFKPKCGALFVSERGTRITPRSIQRIVKKHVIAAGLDPDRIHTHTLRHTAATLINESGTDITVIKEVLGHTTIKTTEVYVHARAERVEGAINDNPLNRTSKVEEDNS